jgi:hypothetical protein
MGLRRETKMQATNTILATTETNMEPCKLTQAGKKLAKMVLKSQRAWDRLREVESEFMEAWLACEAEERKNVVGDDNCSRGGYGFFNDLGA